MRPRRLVLSGFTAFRDEAIVEFGGDELFALTGPTGSGKTSLIDAICFALYGTIPRLPRNAVEPVVSLGAQEARVLFEFGVDGVEYVAARVVRRTQVRGRSGATTAEARLEGGGRVVGGADEVTAAVEDLLGFGFDHFTKCVVLPQGEFASFLHDTPARRQDLLRRLLDLGVYERMRELAVQRRAAAEAEAATLERQVEALAGSTEEAERAAVARVELLEALRRRLEEASPRLEELRARIRRAAESRAGHVRWLAVLEQVAPPQGTGEMAEARRAAVAAVAAATDQVDAASAAVLAAEGRLAGLPSAEEVSDALHLHEEAAGLRARVERGHVVVQEADGALEEARERLAEAVAGHEEARAARDALERAHRAHLVAADLRPGRPCPVCRQTVREVPGREEPQDLAAAVEREESALRLVETGREEAARAEATATAHHRRMEELREELLRVEELLRDRLGHPEARAAREERSAAERSLEEARAAERRARSALDRARAALEQVTERERAGRRVFDETRDALAGLDPPTPARADLAEDWDELATWAGSARERMRAEADRFREDEVEASRELQAAESALAAELRDAGVDPTGGSLRDVCFEAETLARRELERVREERERAAKLEEEARQRRGDAELAKSMARHLSASGFEGWVLEEALHALVWGANHLLADLSAGSYSLDLAGRELVVVDHRNADEQRSVKTLSGGETFLVSLALALSLAEHLTSLSAGGTARLESIFLDEGFGALDGETLETVAAVIQELGASGRTVGLVTHVKELAEQVPVRFEVRKGPRGASVRRVEA